MSTTSTSRAPTSAATRGRGSTPSTRPRWARSISPATPSTMSTAGTPSAARSSSTITARRWPRRRRPSVDSTLRIMSSLRELQAGVRAALLADDERGVAPDVVDDGLSASARLAVYRHHVFTSLTEALEATYPVVCRLVDRRFFGWVADQYVRVRPPAGPCLFEYGADFPEFVAAFPACAHLPWLADVARLEWAMNAALHAPDAPALEPER